MNNNKLLTILIATILVTGCTKQNSNALAEGDSLSEEVKSLETSPDAQRLAFRLLSDEAKYTLWIKQIDWVIQSDNLSDAQKNILSELKQFISPAIFQSPDDAVTARIKVKLGEWKTKASELFNIAFLRCIVTEIHTHQYIYDLLATPIINPSVIQSKNVVAANGCSCHINDDWCSTACQTTSCDKSNRGCGTFWLSSCDGKCAPVPIIISKTMEVGQ